MALTGGWEILPRCYLQLGNSRQLPVTVRWPSVTQTFTLRHRVRVDPSVTFKEIDHVVDVLVDLALVFRRGEAVLVVDTGELRRVRQRSSSLSLMDRSSLDW